MEPKLKGTDILITGGYRTVGRRVPADLAPDYAGRVVAGWSAEEVAQLAVDLGHGGRVSYRVCLCRSGLARTCYLLRAQASRSKGKRDTRKGR